jgi:electron-transferring-flavoprotein dehydrogenase
MKSGLLAAETVFDALKQEQVGNDLVAYKDKFEQSWLFDELYRSRNFGPAIHNYGTFWGGAFNTLDQNVFGGKIFVNLKDESVDHAQMKLASDAQKIEYPKPDGVLSFDKLSSVFLSNTNHEEDQPSHLQLLDKSIPIQVNLAKFDEPAQRYCPAGVYEVIEDDNGDEQFQVNSQNCVHCKTCDIKDPSQNIRWVVPEGAGGPNYPNM